YVIFSTGYLNQFGFPGQDIINRYRVHEVNMLNTAHDGAISIQFRHDQISIVKGRGKSLRYWHN
ncbi:MAG: hypothetical protein WD709_06545, partial [Gammaproteobacteria bacterium]